MIETLELRKSEIDDTTGEREQRRANENEGKTASGHSLSVVLPAYNEEQVIASTVSDVLDVYGVPTS